jgi:methylated-DNA-[protein]-cysteine S-methyltransferase
VSQLERVVPSPVGPIRLRADSAGRLTGLRIGGGVHAPAPEPSPEDPGALDEGGTRVDEGGTHVLDDAVAQLAEYFAGRRRCFDLPLAPEGSPFQRRVWDRLRQIPFGTTTSYGQLATDLGRPGAARAVGHANARNPIAVIIPCHRVIGASGSLTGYGGGLAVKKHLLDLEARAPCAARRGAPVTEAKKRSRPRPVPTIRRRSDRARASP